MDHEKKTLHIEREELDLEASVASGQGTTGGWGRWEESCGEGLRTELVKGSLGSCSILHSLRLEFTIVTEDGRGRKELWNARQAIQVRGPAALARRAGVDKQSPLRYPIMSNKLTTKSHP
jgi:hypothetical protein